MEKYLSSPLPDQKNQKKSKNQQQKSKNWKKAIRKKIKSKYCSNKKVFFF